MGPMQASEECLIAQERWSERGQGLVEYALILILVALAVVIVVALYGESVESIYKSAIPTLVNALSGNATP
jgi:Flp pilus assembly pilin Flp